MPRKISECVYSYNGLVYYMKLPFEVIPVDSNEHPRKAVKILETPGAIICGNAFQLGCTALQKSSVKIWSFALKFNSHPPLSLKTSNFRKLHPLLP